MWKFGCQMSIWCGVSLAGLSRLYLGGCEAGGFVGCVSKSGMALHFLVGEREGETDSGNKLSDQLGQSWVCQSHSMA